MPSSVSDLFQTDSEHLSLVELINENSRLRMTDDESPTLFVNSPYYSNDEFVNVLKDKIDSFSLISLNTQSLNAKFTQLKAYIEFYKQNDITVNAFCLQETWLSDESDTSLLQLEDYNLITKGKACSAHGGVAIYLHKSFNYEILQITESENWDGLAVSVNVNSKQVIVVNIYRPPRSSTEAIKMFSDEITQLFDCFKKSKNVIVAGDFNIDLIKFKNNNCTNDYLDNIVANGYIPKITNPTRLTNRTGTLIDNFLIKLSDNFSQTTSGILIQTLSDHLPYFITLDYLKRNINTYNYVTSYKMDTAALTDFKNFLNNADIMNKINICLNVDEKYESLQNIIKEGLNTCLPIKTCRFNKYKHKKCPWITSGILQSIKHRDKLYRQLKSLSDHNSNFNTKNINFKTYNHILKKSIRLAKQSYYQNCFTKFKNDSKNTWSTIKEIINKTKPKGDFPEYLIKNGSKITKENDIANEFNNFFVNIGPKLAAEIDRPLI